MPWDPEDAHDKTHQARTPKEQRQWAHIADKELEETGDEGRAIREANGIIKKGHGGVGGIPSHESHRDALTESD